MSERDPETPMLYASAVSTGLSILVGWLVGDEPAGPFSWTAAAIGFAPLFVAGVILYVGSVIVEQMRSD